LKKYTFIVLLSIFVTGCGDTGYLIKVDSFGNSDLYSKSYVLLPASDKIGGLEFDEYSAYVHRALKKKEFNRSLNGIDGAKIAIFMDYGISEPKTYQKSYSIPQWGKTGVSSSYTSGTISSYGSYSGTTSHTPTYGVTGYTSGTTSHTKYTRYLKLSAVNVNQWKSTDKSNVTELWKTSITSTGWKGDLRAVMPFLVVASENHLGKDTGEQISIRLKDSDETTQEIKGVMIPEKDDKNTKSGFFNIF
jgi:hypothetical protein